MQEAVACHELVHIRRRGLGLTVIEEWLCARSSVPSGIWWLLGEIQLTREQTVDGEVVRLSAARENTWTRCSPWRARAATGSWPAPLFCSRADLNTGSYPYLTRCLCLNVALLLPWPPAAASLAMIILLATAGLPLPGAAQVMNDGEGVTVETGARVIQPSPGGIPRRRPLSTAYRARWWWNWRSTRRQRLRAHVVSGPKNCGRAVLGSALQWHYGLDNARPGKCRPIVVFRLPCSPRQLRSRPWPPPRRNPRGMWKWCSITIRERCRAFENRRRFRRSRSELLGRLPLRVGDVLTPEGLSGWWPPARLTTTTSPRGPTATTRATRSAISPRPPPG